MKQRAPLSLFIFFSIQLQAWSQHLPEKEEMCGVIVDGALREDCLLCFQNAGSVSENPEAVRECVAIYLPPLVAKCAVPQARTKGDERIEQLHPVVHHNNTNANLLPNCIKRRMRELDRYLQKENMFTKQAGTIVKTVVLTRLVRNGGANMLGVFSQREILKIPLVRALVSDHASSCLDDYEESRSLTTPNMKVFEEEEEKEAYEIGEREFDITALKESLKSNPEYEYEDEEKFEHRAKPDSQGNSLPYGGTNDIAKDMILGDCIIDKLIESNTAIYLITAISNEEFYHPIPSWWAGKLLYYYKAYKEALID